MPHVACVCRRTHGRVLRASTAHTWRAREADVGSALARGVHGADLGSQPSRCVRLGMYVPRSTRGAAGVPLCMHGLQPRYTAPGSASRDLWVHCEPHLEAGGHGVLGPPGAALDGDVRVDLRGGPPQPPRAHVAGGLGRWVGRAGWGRVGWDGERTGTHAGPKTGQRPRSPQVDTWRQRKAKHHTQPTLP